MRNYYRGTIRTQCIQISIESTEIMINEEEKDVSIYKYIINLLLS